MAVSFKQGSKLFVVGNFYAPSNSDREEKASFFEHYSNILQRYKEDTLILAGDWNTVEDLERDILRKGSIDSKRRRLRERIRCVRSESKISAYIPQPLLFRGPIIFEVGPSANWAPNCALLNPCFGANLNKFDDTAAKRFKYRC